ncbi:MAG: hypothetical protein MRJ65_12375 [Candidatus Brocadiaceae bacterium]|nr:hypothetical protein [Candidatus Brocadiaceae bacterium]
MSKRAIREEGSGAFLIQNGPLPSGWSAISEKEGKEIWGKGGTTDSTKEATGCNDHKLGGDSGSQNVDNKQGMAGYSFHTMLASLRIQDTPIGYVPALGPPAFFTIVYNQREAVQDSTNPDFSFIAPNWTFNWVSYLIDIPNDPTQVTLFTRSGGGYVFTGYDSATGKYAPEPMTQAVLTRINPTRYRIDYPDGSVQIFAKAEPITTPGRKVFLTQWHDPAGNKVVLIYNSNFRLVRVLDALGKNALNFTYGSADPLSPVYYRLRKITDRYGRTSELNYNGAGKLIAITDVIGIRSQFRYDSGNFVTSLKTPYGTTQFEYGETADGTLSHWRYIQATDPFGETERLEMWRYKENYYNSDPVGVPNVSGGKFYPISLFFRNSFYWNKQNYKENVGDYKKSHVYHFFHDPDMVRVSRILECEKPPIDNRIWYNYPGQVADQVAGLNMPNTPSIIARVTTGVGDPDPQSQYVLMEYNSIGNRTKFTDVLGRETAFVYAPNEVDLLEVRQQTGSIDELLASFTYNSQHLPQTITDTSGETTTITYTSFGQIETISNAKDETTTFTYITDPQTNGYQKVSSITGSIPGAEIRYTYDAYDRINKVEDLSGSESYIIDLEYDLFDRMTKITYPDSTFESFVYQNLDLVEYTDREGRKTVISYDAMRRLKHVRDPLGRYTRYGWDATGNLKLLVDAANHMTTWTLDIQGRALEKKYHDGKKEVFGWDPVGRLVNFLDPLQQTMVYTYNLDNTIKEIAYQDARNATPSVKFTYDTHYYRLDSMEDGNGTTTYNYHPITDPPPLGAGKLANVDGPWNNDIISYEYDKLGRVIKRSIDEDEFVQTIEFDALGRVTSTDNSLGNFIYNYVNATDRLNDITYPNGQSTTFDYFDNMRDQRLKKITNLDPLNAQISTFDYEYSPVGQITKWIQQAGTSDPVEWTMKYDLADQLLSATLRDHLGSMRLKSFSYSFDKAGNRTSDQIDDSIRKSVFNEVNQLTQQIPGEGRMRVFGQVDEPSMVKVNGKSVSSNSDNSFETEIDVVLGLNTFTVEATDLSGNNNTATQNYEVNVQSLGPNVSVLYNDNGYPRRIVEGNITTTMRWDAANRCVLYKRVEGSDTWDVAMGYDGLGRRTKIITRLNGVVQSNNRFLFEGYFPVQKRNWNGSSVVSEYFAQGQKDWANKRFYTFDHLGSIREVVSPTGAVIHRAGYKPYGEKLNVSGWYTPEWGFQGMQQLKVGSRVLYLTRYRIYDPVLQIWYGPDLLSPDRNYVAFGNNSVNFVDQDGMVAIPWGLGLRAGAGAGALSNPIGWAALGGEVAGLALDSAFDISGAAGNFYGDLWANNVKSTGREAAKARAKECEISTPGDPNDDKGGFEKKKQGDNTAHNKKANDAAKKADLNKYQMRKFHDADKTGMNFKDMVNLAKSIKDGSYY